MSWREPWGSDSRFHLSDHADRVMTASSKQRNDSSTPGVKRSKWSIETDNLPCQILPIPDRKRAGVTTFEAAHPADHTAACVGRGAERMASRPEPEEGFDP
jgi:hypothetical protein